MPEAATPTEVGMVTVSSELPKKRTPLYVTLQHRPVYDGIGVIARVRSALRHAADEWYEFLQHDKRAIVAGLATTIFLPYVFAAAERGWRNAMSGLYTNIVAIASPVVLAGGVYLWCLSKAPNELRKRQLWRQLQTANTEIARLIAESAALDGALSRANAQLAAVERDKAARDAHRPKVSIERGNSTDKAVSNEWPASMRLIRMAPLFEFNNVGDESAFNAQASIALVPTEYRIEFAAPTVAAGKRVAMEITLFEGKKKWRDGSVWDIEKFASAAVSKSIAMRAEEEERRMTDEPGMHTWSLDIARDRIFSELDLPLETGLNVEFDVTYVDFERKRLFRTPHVMTFTQKGNKSGDFRIALSANPVPGLSTCTQKALAAHNVGDF